MEKILILATLVSWFLMYLLARTAKKYHAEIIDLECELSDKENRLHELEVAFNAERKKAADLRLNATLIERARNIYRSELSKMLPPVTMDQIEQFINKR